MDQIKEAFSKVKKDISELKEIIESLKKELKDIALDINTIKLKQIYTTDLEKQEKFQEQEPKQITLNEPENLNKEIQDLQSLEQEWLEYKEKQKILLLNQEKQEKKPETPTQNPTQTPTHIPTHNLIQEKNYPFKALKTLNMPISTRNVGVPTHFPTLPTQTPTHKQISEKFSLPKPIKSQNMPFSIRNTGDPTHNPTHQPTNQHIIQQPNQLNIQQNAEQILSSLDSLKKEVRLKFKRITRQEMLVFSTLYAFEEQNIDDITHSMLAKQLNLSPSSIRGYINQLINKGIPIKKLKLNNKKIVLKISEELKKIASLNTILRLREL